MPSLSEAVGADISGYTPAQPVTVPATAPPAGYQSATNTFLRTPLPPIWQTAPDSISQFANNGIVPQNRIFSPSSTLLLSGNSTVNEYLSSSSSSTSGSSSSSGSSSGSTSSTGDFTQASVSTGTLSPNQIFKGVLQAAKTFQLLSLSASKGCRIQMYSTSLARSNDASRPLDVSPPAGTTQGIICDLALDTSPYTWTFTNRTGQNMDDPQQSLVYVAITNLSAASTSITVTVGFVPLEN